MADRLPPGGRYPAAQLSQPPTHDERCRLVAGQHRAEHERLAEQVGAWHDPETAAAPSSSTADPEEIEAVWRPRETLHKRDLVHEAERVVALLSPAAGRPCPIVRSRSATMNDADATKSPIQRVLALCAEMRKVGRDPHERDLIGALHRWENGERHDRIGEQAIVRLTPPWQR